MHESTTSSSGQAARSGSHGSADGVDSPTRAATDSVTSRWGNGKRTFAQTPSERPAELPSTAEVRCVSQRSVPRVGTATTSGMNGSPSGSASSPASAFGKVIGPLSAVNLQHAADRL